MSRKEQVFFFSGVYGGADKKVDPTNDFAVRTHWFDKRDCYKTFLADMAVLGAPQSDGFKKEDCSVNLQKSLSARKLTLSKRSSAQVISGAGLVVSRTAVSFLPPFMNFQTLTTWVDDFAKRLLHEEIDDMRYEEKESVKEARLQQHRPDQEPDKTEEYFKRLLRGCLLVALIRGRKHLNGRKRTPFADMVEKVVNYRIARKIPDRRALRNKMLLAAKKQCDLVLNCWSSDEFYERASYKWAMTRDPKFKKEVCRELVADAIGYLDLLLAWPIFVHTAEKLRFLHNDWLFEDF